MATRLSNGAFSLHLLVDPEMTPLLHEFLLGKGSGKRRAQALKLLAESALQARHDAASNVGNALPVGSDPAPSAQGSVRGNDTQPVVGQSAKTESTAKLSEAGEAALGSAIDAFF